MPGRHPLHRFACADERTGDVGREHAVDPRSVHFVDAALALENAGVVDQSANRPEIAVDGLEQPDNVSFHRHVSVDRDGAAAGSLDLGDQRTGSAVIVQVVDADRVAARSGQPRRRGADAAARTGNKNRNQGVRRD